MPGPASSAKHLWCSLLWAAASSLPLAAGADQLTFDTAQDWNRWQLPLGAVQVTAEGTVAPVMVRKNVEAVVDAAFFGGGIRKVGSNAADAALVMDGDPNTGWSPDPQDPVEDWFIEVDLGRGVSANEVTLVFAADAPPFELFDLLLSTGEPQTDNIAAPIPGTLVYRIKERYKENGQHTVRFMPANPDDTPIQYIRLENFKSIPGAKLVEVQVEAIGDNIALNLLERGGNMDVVADLANTAESVPLSNVLALVDGDLYQRWAYGRASRGQNDIDAHIIIDLGAVYWLDLTRISGGVVVRSPSETARGDFGIYDLNRRLITLIGAVRLERGDSRISGGRMTIDLDSGRAVVDGGPRGVGESGGRVTGRFTVPQRTGG